VVPVVTEVPTYRVDTFDEKENDEAIRLELDLIDEKRSEALTRLAAQKRKVERYYNAKVKRWIIAVGSLVLRYHRIGKDHIEFDKSYTTESTTSNTLTEL
jgi:predicted DNA-binding WGR domain protein